MTTFLYLRPTLGPSHFNKVVYGTKSGWQKLIKSASPQANDQTEIKQIKVEKSKRNGKFNRRIVWLLKHRNVGLVRSDRFD